jgi:hypothetical protein
MPFKPVFCPPLPSKSITNKKAPDLQKSEDEGSCPWLGTVIFSLPVAVFRGITKHFLEKNQTTFLSGLVREWLPGLDSNQQPCD